MSLYAIDGTWNDDRDGELDAQTNVFDFMRAYDGIGVFYKKGVGTRFGAVGRVAGGVFGAGGHDRVNDAYHDICRTFEAGDKEIAIVGFSRGAALSLALANKLHTDGIRKPGTNTVIQPAPEIQFLGLFDVVGSFGIPGNPINIGYPLTCPPNVKYCAHAMALDEQRPTFPVTRVRPANEVWFRGGHSDIGGGNRNRLTNNISLRWMLRKAQAAGLAINQSKIPTDADIDPQNPLMVRPTVIHESRKVLEGDRVHYTVRERTVEPLWKSTCSVIFEGPDHESIIPPVAF